MSKSVRDLNVPSVFKRMDIFGVDIPTFNIKGETKVMTVSGGLLSLLVGVVFFIYGSLKLSHLLDKYNPSISEIKEFNFYDSSERLVLDDFGFRIAFTVESYLQPKLRNDPRYVKYMARVFTKTAGVESETIIPYGICTED